jgi:phosphatidylethanolamine/phosphatidyl-N-methylethanolamine N-methyltransferase
MEVPRMARYPTAEEAAAVESRRVERVYSVLASGYDAFFDWALGPGRRRAIASLPIRPGDRVLEVGVGTGLSLPFYPEECHVTGVDIAEPMLERARMRLDLLGRDGVDLRRMDARDLKFPDGCFDHVVAPYVISVVPEPERVMAEMARVCRPGGSVIVVNHFLSENPVLGFFERLLTPASRWIGFRMDLPVSEVVPTAGLELVRSKRVNLFGLWRLLELSREG